MDRTKYLNLCKAVNEAKEKARKCGQKPNLLILNESKYGTAEFDESEISPCGLEIVYANSNLQIDGRIAW